ncbi:(2Fe-2S)-binding protein [Streptomyces sp. NBC_01317]|uniref:(2Fe-2S)-binding protein n=1 Tax=Streptomyces sp. NBC_01317 TaxID=2903822 RepID=UPI002E15F100|nr:(2Fe-2S)-binding protein [Streptomyces sp. NBC_01317]
MNRVYVCSCFGITEKQVREHADSGACTPRQIASASKAGTDCGSCVRRIQSLLGRGAVCPRRELLKEPVRAEAVLTESTLTESALVESVFTEAAHAGSVPAA